MAKFDPYGPFSGVKDALALLKLMDDPKGRKDIIRVIDGFEQARLKLNETIETYGKLSEIDSLRSQEKNARDEASKALREAKAEAERIIEAANARAAELDQERQEIDAAAERVASDRAALEAEMSGLETRRAELTAAIKGAEAREKAATKATDEAKAAKSEYEGKLADLRRITA